MVGGPDERQGRVELCNDEAWGTVCDDWWGTADARVACAQLGFSRDGELLIFMHAFISICTLHCKLSTVLLQFTHIHTLQGLEPIQGAHLD